jgi:hypothetical protein
MLSLDEVYLYSGCELSTSVTKRSMEYVPGSTWLSCPLFVGGKDWVAEEFSRSCAFEVTCNSVLALGLNERS